MPLYSSAASYQTQLFQSGLVYKNSNYTAVAGDQILADTTSQPWTLSLPAYPSVATQVLIYAANDMSVNNLGINLQGNNFEGLTPGNNGFQGIKISTKFAYTSLIYTGTSQGWIDYPQGQILKEYSFVSGMALWLNGGLGDLSGNNNNASPVGTNSPNTVTGLDSQPFLQWNGSGTQELKVTPFLAETVAATLYIIFTVSSSNNYNLIRTYSALDDYWHFSNDGNAYIGTFTNSRFNAYPATTPSSGSHLISIHADASGYELLLDNASKGFQSGNYYYPGDEFRIVSNDKLFDGSIGTLLVYPFFIDKSSSSHSQNIAALKQIYPSLSLS